ncbi:MAG: hypothetical protein D6714_05205 [Bacteroidetes bacterium]|nr:MAG: hypothetical protein D6714_05205 [Bacteroidota bacterium]
MGRKIIRFYAFFQGLVLSIACVSTALAAPEVPVFSFENPCDVTMTPGQVGPDQVVCMDNNQPQIIKEILPPTGSPDGYEFLWIYTTTPPSAPTVVWYPVNAATNAEFLPEPLSVTTWFRRCARPVGCDVYIAESNIVKIEVKDCTADCSTFTAALEIQQPVTCAGNADGRLRAHPEGGKAPFSYAWNHAGLSGADPGFLLPGDYAVTITDANGCTATATASLTEPAPLQIEFEAFPESCAGHDGAVFVTVSGGTPPYAYEWGNGWGNAPVLEGIPAGYYVVWVVDAFGCKGATEILVSKKCNSLQIDFGENDVEYNPSEGVIIRWVVENERPGSLYLVEKSRNNRDFEVLSSLNGIGFKPEGTHYKFCDRAPLPGANFYRITEIHPATGKVIAPAQYILVENGALADTTVYPNPVVESAFLDFRKPLDAPALVRLFNQNGNPVGQWEVPAGILYQELDLGQLPSGTYQVFVEKADERPEVFTVLKAD